MDHLICQTRAHHNVAVKVAAVTDAEGLAAAVRLRILVMDQGNAFAILPIVQL